MNTIWGFGCSFTQGVVITLDSNYSQYHHLQTVSQQLLKNTGKSYQVVNHARGGIGNRSILYILLRYIHEFQPGDKVIIGLTAPDRETVMLKNKKDKWGVVPEKFKNNVVHTMVDYLNAPKSKKQQYRDVIYPPFRQLSDEEMNALVDHYMVISVGGLHTLLNERNYIKNVLHNIQKTLQKLDVDVYLWDNPLWYVSKYAEKNCLYNNTNVFETITQWTKGEIQDKHWSPNGNHLAGLFFYWCIVNDYTQMNIDLIPEFCESKLFNEYQYINYH